MSAKSFANIKRTDPDIQLSVKKIFTWFDQCVSVQRDLILMSGIDPRKSSMSKVPSVLFIKVLAFSLSRLQ